MLGAVMLAAAPALADAQSITYNSGQNVAPAYEGWEEDADGTRYFVFGYMNRNWVEEIDVPIGENNSFAPGPADQGQPTHLLPRRNRFVFRVRVPQGFSATDELVWTLTTNGETERAYASLREDYKLDDVVKASETGALGAGSSSPEIRANKPPTVRIEGSKSITAKVGVPVDLVAVMADDGIPKRPDVGFFGGSGSAVGERTQEQDPERARAAQARLRGFLMGPPIRITVGKNVGLHLSWFHYRGPGTVTFTPSQIKVWEDTRAGANSPWAPVWLAPPVPADGRITAKATFSEPGTYVLRALADDGALLGSDDLTVTVTR